MSELELLPLENLILRLDGAVEQSPADVTEIVWLELVRAEVGSGKRRFDVAAHPETVVLVRIEERGRLGFHRTGASSPGELANAVRQALGQARLQPPGAWRVPPAGARQRVEPSDDGLDPELARLEPDAARELLGSVLGKGESGRLSWTVGRVVVANSRGLRQQAVATSAVLRLRGSRGPGSSEVTTAARHLHRLEAEACIERLRELQPPEPSAAVGEVPDGPCPAVVSGYVAADLLRLLNRHALSSGSFRQRTSFLRSHLDERLFDEAFHLVDDASKPEGLPFPFDLFGYAKRPVTLIEHGVIRSPAVDVDLAGELDLTPTPHAVAVDESRAGHLFLAPGELSLEELLARGEGGVWIGRLDRLGCFDPVDVRFRAVARGVRVIEPGGRLGSPLPDLVWEDDVRRVFSRLAGVGRDVERLPGMDGFWGGVVAPALALPQLTGLRPFES